MTRSALSLVSLSLFIFTVWCFKHHRCEYPSWNEPTAYFGDAYIELGYLKAVAQGDCTWLGVRKVHRLNAPCGSDWQNFPMYEKVPLFAIGTVTRFTSLAFASNVGLVLARVTAAGAFWIAAHYLLGCSRLWAWVGGALFALLYYHDWRGLNHLMLNFVWTIPLFVAATWRKPKLWVLLAVAFAVGISNPYWVLGALILTAVCRQTIRTKVWLVAGLSVGFILSNLVTILWATKLALLRHYIEAERFALKPIDLILPPPGGLFGNWSHHYVDQVMSPWRGEMFSPYLGIVGIAALTLLIYDWMFHHWSAVPIAQVSVILIAASIGGLTCFMSLCGLTMFRAANRLSEFIAAICLLYLVLRLCLMRLPWKGEVIVGALLVMVVCIESLNFPQLQPRVEATERYQADVRFGQELDRLCPNQKLYNFPPMFFPDCVMFPTLEPYTHLRPWLHTSKVSFSFGQATNRLSAFDEESLKGLAGGMVNFDRCRTNGFWGVLFARKMFADNMDGLLAQMKPEATSPDFALIKLAK